MLGLGIPASTVDAAANRTLVGMAAGLAAVLGLDAKNPDAVASYTITPEAAGACPVK